MRSNLKLVILLQKFIYLRKNTRVIKSVLDPVTRQAIIY